MSSPASGAVAFRIMCPLDGEGRALAALLDLGTLGAESRPGASCEETMLLAYFTDRPGLEDDLRRALAGLPGCLVERSEIPDVDWVARFRESFRPLAIGGFFVSPPWHVGPAAAGQRLLRVDPGRAFGTGTHETTRLCLAAIESLAASRPLGRVLDVGTGSGILAVACCLLGAAGVTAIDNDADAIASARAHALLNGVAFSLVRGDGAQPFRPGGFDLVLANLQAPLLMLRRDELVAQCAPGGHLVLSGLLLDDLPALRAAYADAGALRSNQDGEWVAATVAPFERHT